MPQQVQPKLILYILMAMGFLGGYIFYSQGAVNEAVVLPLEAGKDDISKFKDLKIDFKVLDNPKIKALKTFGEYPVTPGTAGKKDVFAPVP